MGRKKACTGRGRIVWGCLWSSATTHVHQSMVRALGEGRHESGGITEGQTQLMPAGVLEAKGGMETGSSCVLRGEEAFSRWRRGVEEVE